MSDEETYKAELAKAGVDLPELKETPEPEKEPEQEQPEKAPEAKAEEAPKQKEPLQEPKEEPRKPRSIYEEYKDKKSELKTEKELREQAEKERDQLAEKLRIATEGKGESPDTDADDAIAYAKKVGADPDLVQRIIRDAQAGLKSTDPEVKARLDKFDAWEKSQASVIEKQRFNEEFESIIPTLKESFPSASDEELKAIKQELDAISHTKDWHDKDLDYIAFKHKDKLSALVSPKKRGMEGKGRKDVADVNTFEFDPNADYSKLSGSEKKQWEEAYKAAGKSELLTSADGKKLIL